MRSLRVDLGSGGRCELYHRTDYRGASSKTDVGAFMRASLSDLNPSLGETLARRDALSFVQFHRLGTAAYDLASVLKKSVSSGAVIVVVEQRRSPGAGSRGSNEPRPRSITFTPSQVFRGAARMAGSIGASAPARIRLPADDGIAIWFAKPGDVLPDGTIATPVATPLTGAQPFDLGDDALPGDSIELAGRGERGNMYACDVISSECKGSVLREFPGQYLNSTLNDIQLEAQDGVKDARKALKLLNDNRFKK